MEAARFLPLIGRLLIGLVFLMSGLGKLVSFGPTTAYISSVGLPLAPLGWAIAVVMEIAGGLSLIVGFRVKKAALGLAGFTLVAGIFFHHDFADKNQMIHFLKNLVIIGGFLQIAYFGAGSYSLDARRLRNPNNVVGARI
jgi:putative oxidoreductase